MWAILASAQERPNIVLVVVDDMGFSDFGAFGGEIATPNIDALARAGARFSNFHAASSCAPTRAMLMTGVDSHRAGVGSMRELMPLSHRGEPGYAGVLNERVQTVASLLRDAGYRTSVAGKWHLGHEPQNLPPARGFDYSLIQADSGADNFEMRPYLPMQLEVYWYENGERLDRLPADFYSSTGFVDRTITFLQDTADSNSPFFAYVAFQANHTPIQAPARFIDAYRGRYTEGWHAVRQARVRRIRELGLLADDVALAPGPTQAQWDALQPQQQYFEARRMQAYAGMATAMDHELGRLLDYLRASGQYQNTVFVLLSDNGAVANEPYSNAFARRWLESNFHREVESLGEKGSWVGAGSRWGIVSNTPLAGNKFFAGEGGVRVPLIVSGLRGMRAGSIHRDFTYVTDITPTLLEIAGVASAGSSAGETISGRSLLPLLLHAGPPPRSAQESTGYEFSGNAALYRGNYKLVRNLPPVGDGAWRLYDIERDPGETADLAVSQPALFRDMQSAYADYADAAGVLPMPADYNLARQVGINSMLFVYAPHYLPRILAGVALFALALLLWRRARRRGLSRA
ncbi:MAG: arylsulfatase [Halioglobus sp.]|nr:arylsulfatase [Halioglobus sp.]